MGKLFLITLFATATASLALPRGLSGFSLGFGAIFPDYSPGLIQVEYDYGITSFLSLGPEFYLIIDHFMVGGGAEAKVYVIPHLNSVVQPFGSFGGYGAVSVQNILGFILHSHFGIGTDIDVPNSKISPYLDASTGYSVTGGGNEFTHKVEAGIRF